MYKYFSSNKIRINKKSYRFNPKERKKAKENEIWDLNFFLNQDFNPQINKHHLSLPE